jgi:ribosome-associated toxin RatA of RatAB toxin-antitoxin module
MFLKISKPIFVSMVLLCLNAGGLFWFPQFASQFASAEVTQILSQSDQTTLNAGKVVLTGQDGNYIGKIIINTSAEKVWNVLTDYTNFPKFLPTVTAVKLLESHGNQKVYEQTNVVQVLFFTQSSKVAIAATETYPSGITFQLGKGDSIKALKGSWQIEVISPNQVLVTNQVNVEPNSATPKDIFFSIYSDNLAKTLTALKQETEKRSQGN